MIETAQVLSSRGARAARPLTQLATQLDALRRAMSAGSRPPPYATAAERARILQRELERMRSGAGLQPSVEGMLPLGPALIVASHTDDLDPVVLGSLVPCALVVEHERVPRPLGRRPAAQLGVITVDRGCAHSGARALRQIARSLAQGVSVVVFPGPRAGEGDPAALRPAALGLVRRLGVPIVPVRIDHEPPGDDGAPRSRERSRVRVRVLEPLWPRRRHPVAALAELVGRRLAAAAPRWRSAATL